MRGVPSGDCWGDKGGLEWKKWEEEEGWEREEEEGWERVLVGGRFAQTETPWLRD